jgi:hypothetical protein
MAITITAKVIGGTVRYFDASGQEVTTAQAKAAAATDPAAVAETNRRALISKAQAALTSNATYLAITSPTTAQNTAQVKALTRQVNALIRLTVKALDTTTGT